MIEHQRVRVHAHLTVDDRAGERSATAHVFKGPYEPPSMNERATNVARAALGYVPTFDVYRNDVWRKRVGSLQRLTYLVGKWIVRQRAQRRLVAIQRRLGDAKSRAEVRRLASLDERYTSRSLARRVSVSV